MLPFRRNALRALQSRSLHITAGRNARTLITTSPTAWRSSPSSIIQLRSPSHVLRSNVLRSIIPTIRRGYATEEEEPREMAEGTAVDASESADRVETGFDADKPLNRERKRTTNYPPNSALYVGNLFFETSEETLKELFQSIGEVTKAKIIYDGRGLSKGYGYVEFEDVSTATRAMEQFDNHVLGGRNILVQYAAQKARNVFPTRDGEYVPLNPPTKTLFIGNMSYSMTDKDLNELFRDVKNVLEVRVAVDRRTSQPRGFAHADFVDIKSAVAALEHLKEKEYYGRRLRVDFSGPSLRRTDATTASDQQPATENEPSV